MIAFTNSSYLQRVCRGGSAAVLFAGAVLRARAPFTEHLPVGTDPGAWPARAVGSLAAGVLGARRGGRRAH